eukprot:TRINITY_DN5507_c0_g2_i1.p1 TRINITY_DN5507_c0_g2~~TRINITY_DN5507_c0_g2_i1.p1  ORF type:complete len:458 (+),score=33.49 TRINITY_DN5507_c0_g2_i1:123-1496(+)
MEPPPHTQTEAAEQDGVTPSPATADNLNDACLENVFSLMGPGHYIFLSCCKRWQQAYWLSGQLKMETALQHVADLPLLQWAVSPSGGGHTMSEVTCAAAARDGHLESLQWLREAGCSWDRRTCTEAARRGDLTMLQWASDAGAPICQHTAIEAAAGRGHLQAVQWLHARGFFNEFFMHASVSAAAKAGHLHVLQWLSAVDRFHTQGHRKLMFIAAQEGHLAIAHWLHASRSPGDWNLSEVCEAAAEGGHLHVLQFLRDNGYPWGSTCSAAAAGGHLNVLLYARDGGCPWGVRTCSAAAAGGHLDVLLFARRWLPLGRRNMQRCGGQGTSGGAALCQGARVQMDGGRHTAWRRECRLGPPPNPCSQRWEPSSAQSSIPLKMAACGGMANVGLRTHASRQQSTEIVKCLTISWLMARIAILERLESGELLESGDVKGGSVRSCQSHSGSTQGVRTCSHC